MAITDTRRVLLENTPSILCAIVLMNIVLFAFFSPPVRPPPARSTWHPGCRRRRVWSTALNRYGLSSSLPIPTDEMRSRLFRSRSRNEYHFYRRQYICLLLYFHGPSPNGPGKILDPSKDTEMFAYFKKRWGRYRLLFCFFCFFFSANPLVHSWRNITKVYECLSDQERVFSFRKLTYHKLNKHLLRVWNL